MSEGLLIPIVAAIVTLAVLVVIPVIVVRSSIARRRDAARKRANFIEPSEQSVGDDSASGHRRDRRYFD